VYRRRLLLLDSACRRMDSPASVKHLRTVQSVCALRSPRTSLRPCVPIRSIRTCRRVVGMDIPPTPRRVQPQTNQCDRRAHYRRTPSPPSSGRSSRNWRNGCRNHLYLCPAHMHHRRRDQPCVLGQVWSYKPPTAGAHMPSGHCHFCHRSWHHSRGKTLCGQPQKVL
jgi:hypothetical protein